MGYLAYLFGIHYVRFDHQQILLERYPNRSSKFPIGNLLTITQGFFAFDHQQI